MDSARFDALARALAGAVRSRRQVARVLAGGLVGTSLGAFGSQADAKDDNGSGKDKGDENKKQGKNGNGKGPACREDGHSCEGNQECCAGLICGPSGSGAASRCTAPSAQECVDCAQPAVVKAVAAYSVQTTCAYDQAADRTTCTCTGAAPAGASAVRSVAVASAAVCADVVGGDSSLGTPGPAIGSAGFTSAVGQAALTLILTGKVTTGGSATYWCMTDAGTVPAQGPGLVREQTDVSDTAGAVEVRVATCDVGAPVPAGYDWHGRCSHPATGARFALKPAGPTGVVQATGSASADGRVPFRQLKPGAYLLTQTGADWCHAESDGVDTKGNVIVKAGQRTTVWIFDCIKGGS